MAILLINYRELLILPSFRRFDGFESFVHFKCKQIHDIKSLRSLLIPSTWNNEKHYQN